MKRALTTTILLLATSAAIAQTAQQHQGPPPRTDGADGQPGGGSLARAAAYSSSSSSSSQDGNPFAVKPPDPKRIKKHDLLTVIINPAMVASWALGVWMAVDGGLYRVGWFQAKFVLVLMLSAMHGFLSRCVREFAADANTRPAKFYRVINEVPTLLMFGIVILAIVKPF